VTAPFDDDELRPFERLVNLARAMHRDDRVGVARDGSQPRAGMAPICPSKPAYAATASRHGPP
jgi:hypothetical protein